MTISTQVRELSEEARYAALSARFQPVFARIAEGALERESNHVLPFEPVAWLRDSGFTTIRVPAEHGGTRSATST